MRGASAVVGIVLSLLFPLAGSAKGQLTSSDFESLRARGKKEGWTFKIRPNAATQRPLSQLCGLRPPISLPQDQTPVATFSPLATGELPTSFNWKTLGGCTPVKDQEDCGSCWAFATVGPFESAIKIKDGVTVDLSEQYLLNCQTLYTCDGGWWVHNLHTDTADSCGGIGAVLESALPYQAYQSSCGCPYAHPYRLRSWAFVEGALGVASVEAIKQAMMTYGPIGVCINADSAFQAYSGGVFNACASGLVNHMVVLVGWDDSQGTSGVWILRNSWGTDWGESGYMRIEYGCSSVGWSATYVDYAGLDPLRIAPAAGLSSSGPEGGPFSPSAITYTLTNTGTTSLNWTATRTQAWVDVAPTGGTLGPNAVVSVTASLNAGANALLMGTYSDTITFRNTSTGMNQTRAVSLRVGQPDYFTELFDAGDNDLQNITATFSPNGSGNFYSVCSEAATQFPTNPAGGTALTLDEDDYIEVKLTGGKSVSLYGTSYTSLYVSSNGYITFGSGDDSYTESLTAHFNKPRTSAFFHDLSPQEGGSVSWKQTSDRVAVTFVNVPEYSSSNLNSFQIELFFNGKVAITWLNLDGTDGLAGLSRGTGVPTDYVESDLSAYSVCGPKPPTASDGSATAPVNAPVSIALTATDDGLPSPPASLQYIITALPMNGSLNDPAAGAITTTPHILTAGGQQVSYTPAANYEGIDSFTFKANDGGTAPSGGDSNPAVISLTIGGPMAFLNEGFESAFVGGAPPGWTKAFKTGTVDWIRNNGDHETEGAHGGTYNALLYTDQSSDHETYLISPTLDFGTGPANAVLEFWHQQRNWSGDQDTLTVVYKKSAGGSWTTLATYTSDVSTWMKRTISLPDTNNTYTIAFLGNAKYGYGVCLDEVTVTGQPSRKLELTETNGDWGDVQITPEPNDPNALWYPKGTLVTFTATPVEGKAFRHWEIFDPNFPDDANRATLDANTTLTVLLHQDTHVNAVWKCGSGAEQALTLLWVGAAVVGITRRRSQ